MVISRRDAMLSVVAGLIVPWQTFAFEKQGQQDNDIFLSCRILTNGSYTLACMNAGGHVFWENALPGRGHGFAIRQGTDQFVVFARRPGQYAMVVDVRTGKTIKRLSSITGRHFYGHGVFDRQVKRLYTSENDFERGRGVIGIYDADSDYRRLGELDSGGIGPHEVVMLHHRDELVVANGGVRTHPDFGRTPLNIDSMRPNVAWLDPSSGVVNNRLELPESRRRLSLRHLAVSDVDRVCVAGQIVSANSAGEDDMLEPLVAFSDGDSQELGIAPDAVQKLMRRYLASVAWLSDPGLFVVTAPHAGVVTLWSQTGQFQGSIEVARDSAGVCSDVSGKTAWISADTGKLLSIDFPSRVKSSHQFALVDGYFDNHITCVPRA